MSEDRLNGGGGPGGGGEPGGGEPGGGGQPAGGEWMSGLSEDNRAALAPKNFENFDAFAQSYLNLERKIGAQGLIVPKEDAPQTEKDAFLTALGRPEKPEGYELAAPEGVTVNEDLVGWFRDAAHKAGLSAAAAKQLFDAWNERQISAAGEAEKASATAYADNEKFLREQWGKNFDAKLDTANRAIADRSPLQEDGTKGGLAAELRDLNLANMPHLAMALESLGAYEAEDDGGAPGRGARNESSPAEAKAEIERLKADPDFSKAYTDRAHAQHKEAVARMDRLHRIAHGTGA